MSAREYVRPPTLPSETGTNEQAPTDPEGMRTYPFRHPEQREGSTLHSGESPTPRQILHPVQADTHWRAPRLRIPTHIVISSLHPLRGKLGHQHIVDVARKQRGFHPTHPGPFSRLGPLPDPVRTCPDDSGIHRFPVRPHLAKGHAALVEIQSDVVIGFVHGKPPWVSWPTSWSTQFPREAPPGGFPY